MAKDFKADQLVTKRIIYSGSLKVYPQTLSTDNEGGNNFSPDNDSDIFIHIPSGSKGQIDGTLDIDTLILRNEYGPVVELASSASFLSSQVGSIAIDLSDLNDTVDELSGSVSLDVNDLQNQINNISVGDGLFYSDVDGLIQQSGSLSLSGSVTATNITAIENSVTSISSSFSGRITANEGDILDLQGETTQLFISASASANSIGDLQNDLTALSGTVSTDVNDLQNQINNISPGDSFFYSDTNGLIEQSGSLALSGTIAASNITTIENDLTALSGTVSTDINDLDTRIGTNEGDILVLQGETTQLFVSTSVNANDIGDLNNDLTALSGAVSTDVNDLQNQINNISVGDGLFYSDTDGLIEQSGSLALSGSITATNITTIEGDILDLQGETTQLFVSTSANANSIGDLNNDLTALSGALASRVADTENDITFIQGETSQLFVSTSANASNILQNAGDITNLGNDLTALSGAVSTDVNDLQNQINNISTGDSFFFSETANLIEQSGSLALSGTISATNITTIENDLTALSGGLASRVAAAENDILDLQGETSQLFVSTSTNASGILQNENDIIDLGNDLNALSGALASRVEDTENDILFIQGETSDLFVSTSQNANDIGDLNNDLSSLSGSVSTDINSLDGRITTNEGDILVLQGETVDLFISASANANSIGDLQNDLTALSGSVSTDINSLDGRVGVNEGDILDLQGETTQLFVSTSVNANDIGNLQNDLTALSGSVSTDINSLDGRVGVNEGDILVLQGETVDLFISASANANDIGDLNNDLTALSGTVSTDVNDLQNQINNISTGDSFFYSETDELIEQSGSLSLSGSGLFLSGLTGALNVLPDGQSFIVSSDESITITTGSNGQIDITTVGGGPGGDSFFFSNNANLAETTGSIAISSSLVVDNQGRKREDIGTDVAHYLSSSIGGKNQISGGVTVFGGDTVTSGTLYYASQVPEVFATEINGAMCNNSEAFKAVTQEAFPPASSWHLVTCIWQVRTLSDTFWDSFVDNRSATGGARMFTKEASNTRRPHCVSSGYIRTGGFGVLGNHTSLSVGDCFVGIWCSTGPTSVPRQVINNEEPAYGSFPLQLTNPNPLHFGGLAPAGMAAAIIAFGVDYRSTVHVPVPTDDQLKNYCRTAMRELSKGVGIDRSKLHWPTARWGHDFVNNTTLPSGGTFATSLGNVTLNESGNGTRRLCQGIYPKFGTNLFFSS